jgi:hypothetical protein
MKGGTPRRIKHEFAALVRNGSGNWSLEEFKAEPIVDNYGKRYREKRD